MTEHGGDDWHRVTVVGAGTMGAGIAELCASKGLTATLVDVDEAVLERARTRIEASVRRAHERGRLEGEQPAAILSRIHTTTDLAAGLEGSDLVIEAVPESLELKKRVLTTVCEQVAERCLVGTNTSSLPITELAAVCERPERVVGLHFFNPPPRMPLLEIVRGERTSDDTIARARAFAERLGKRPIVVRDVPGFASSRLGIALGLEAMRMLEEGVASADDIDAAMRLGYRHPMGPLELTDLVGLDVRLGIAQALHRELGERFRPPQLLRRMVRAGKLGRKSGEGFYRYAEDGSRLPGDGSR